MCACRSALLCLVAGIAAPSLAQTDPERDLHAAVGALARTSHRWETTVRQRFTGESTELRLHPNAALELQGTFESGALYQLTWMPTRELAVPVTAVFRDGDVVVHTPLGWLRRSDLRQVPGADREVEFEGKKIRLGRLFSTALKVSALRPLSEDLFDLLADVKSVKSSDGVIIAELRDATIEKLWADARAKRAPEVQGVVIFKLAEQSLAEIHFALAIGFPNDRTRKIAWSMQQWSTRIAGLGSTSVAPPEAALQALDK